MEFYKMMDLGDKTKLVVPINADFSMDEIIGVFNSCNYEDTDMVIFDLMVYVGNRNNRFQSCLTDKGKVSLNRMKSYDPSKDLLEKAYELFSHASLGAITNIFSPTLRKIVLCKRNNLKKI